MNRLKLQRIIKKESADNFDWIYLGGFFEFF